MKYSTQVNCEVVEKTSQDASDECFQSFSFQSVACCMVRAHGQHSISEILDQ